ncbi:hypothetical protein ACFFU8_07640 [Chromobacterium piscinae]|uniref:hypothetical protein n=1 Tax=Chromobacterium piscinae TaxID=686831 RepID=UPI001E40E3C8|nr:hypothetical protein [Chromobacterium piscinae]MCD4503824.1 hypothetical protein [Chromobacterium piscinae]MCD5330468.1 hypothetical protein [Chromobacterium piscinae]
MISQGLIQVPRFDVAVQLERRVLVEVMPAHLVCPGRHHLSRRVQAFSSGWRPC